MLGIEPRAAHARQVVTYIPNPLGGFIKIILSFSFRNYENAILTSPQVILALLVQ
jgi:hypothetical protein